MLYIVLVAIANDHHLEWHRWMRDEHIPDVLATGCFLDAVLVRDADADTAERTAYRVHYRAYSQQAFDRYVQEFAAALRADHMDRFGQHVVAQRELLPVLLHLGKPE